MSILSICIPTYNRCDLLIDNLKHLKKIDATKVEIIISDNCSTDETEKEVNIFIKNNNLHNYHYYKNSSNIGPDKNFIKALTYSSSKYSILLGDDDIINISFLENLLEYLNENYYSIILLKDNKSSTSSKITQYKIENMDYFLINSGPTITFMSSIVFNNNILAEVINKNLQYKSNLIQSFLAIDSILLDETLECVIIENHIFDFNGPTSAENYDFYQVFVNNIFYLFSYALKDKNVKQVAKIYRSAFFSFLIKFTIILKCLNIRQRLNKQAFKILKSSFTFWFIFIPIYLIPRPIYKITYKLYRKVKKKNEKINN